MGVLDNIKILDFTRLLPGPFCTLLLADLGANVIKVEEKGRGDYAREMLPGAYYSVNRNKRSLAIDLKKDGGKEIIKDLAAKSDVLVEGFRPGVACRLGIDYNTIVEHNPEVIYCSLSGYGQYGPYKLDPGHDINYLSLTGVMSIPGQVGLPPARSGLPVGDLAAAMYAVVSILAALYHRRESGEGQFIDISITDCVFSWASTRFGGMGLELNEEPEQVFDHIRATNDIFTTGDGKKIALGIIEEPFWENFCKVIGRPDLLEDEKFKSDSLRCQNSLSLHKILTDIFLSNTRDYWLDLLSKNVPVSTINSIKEALSDPHLSARNMIQRIKVPYLNKEIIQVPFAGKLSKTPPDIRQAPPTLGQHTEEILTKELGLTPLEIKNLRQNGVID
ncbi:MAG: hypothetical protein VR67_03595 [Peptococcaceae bacterium BRH_c8a]|nr:MAG: hypothetical protein VR67_10010 [Peptococcaceae bacterium BRH_c8a]KJS13600.1 MAG: hypothetical protein VR67_03595 [Peptococcaceae bacterium BRH_c8a]